MMMTTSRNNVSYFDIEKYAIAYREGFYDNKGVGSSAPEYNFDAFISNNSKEIRETTLPKNKIFGEQNEVVIESKIVRYDSSKSSYEGSGGAYLSNEIMYRTTKLRDELGLKDKKYVGHFHLGINKNINEMLSTILVVKGIITKSNT